MKRAPEPCRLELTLLEASEVCPSCGHVVVDHPYWPHTNPDHTNYDRNRDPDRLRVAKSRKR